MRLAKGKFVETRTVKNGLTQKPYCYPKPNIRIWAAAKGHVWIRNCDVGREDRAIQFGPTPHHLKFSGERAVHRTWAAQ